MDQAVYIAIGESLKNAPKGFADFELTDVTRIPKSTVKAALRDLSRATLIYDSGDKRFGPNGKSTVWFAYNQADFSIPIEVKATLPAKKSPKESKRVKVERDALAAKFLQCVNDVALKQPTFTVDDVRSVFDETEDFGLCDPRISGPVMVQAGQNGWCVRTDQVIVSGRRKAGLTSVYRSLLCEADTETLDNDPIYLRSKIAMLEKENSRLKSEVASLKENIVSTNVYDAVND